MTLSAQKEKKAVSVYLNAVRKYWLDFLLYLTCCLPFLRILPLESDMQPYAFIVAFIYLIVHRKDLSIPRFHKITFWMFAAIVVIAAVQLLLDSDLSVMMLVRKLYNYAALYFVSLALINSIVRTNGLKEGWIKFFILLWLTVGVIQLVYDREFLSFLVSNYRTNKIRGVCCLASEPSFYGYVMVFFFVLSNEFKRGRLLFQGICILQVVALAQSAVSFVYLVVFAFMFIVGEIVHFRRYTKKQKIVRLIVGVGGIVLCAVGVIVVLKTMRETRFVEIWINLFTRLSEIKSMDAFHRVDGSIAMRVESIFLTFRGFAESYGLPRGFGPVIFDGIDYVRIMSGYGSIIFELGVLGVALVVLISRELICGLKNGLVFGVSVCICMFSAIQPGSPVFIFVLACAMYAGGKAALPKLNTDEFIKTLVPSKKKKEG